jgi:predicted flap endonuclease-1-like 5' DNA nuclease
VDSITLVLAILIILLALVAVSWWLTRQKASTGGPTAAQLAAPPFGAAPASSAPPAPASDNLVVIEGIGPKIAAVLTAAGIGTFAGLASTDLTRLEQVLSDAKLPLAKPGTWPAQAALARDGKWDELKTMQDSLKDGV